jgi:hypothetical protein
MPTNKEAETDAGLLWRPMNTCPTGPKVLLLNKGGIAGIGWFDGKDKWWIGWHPLPKISKEMKEMIGSPTNIGGLVGD